MPSKVEGWKDEVYGEEVRDHLFRFAEEGWSAIPEDEHDAWFERFKWWGLYHQRKGQESYFMMRIGTPNGRMTPEQLRVVGEIAKEYATGPVDNPEFGDAYCDWTTRQSIQLHWIQLQDVPEIFGKLEAHDLSTIQACGDSWRNIVGSPMAGRDADEHIDAWPVIRDLHDTFKGNDDHANLPRKWKVAVTGDTRGSGQAEINDLGFEPATKDGQRGFNVTVGGGLSRKEPRFARDIDVFVTPETISQVAGGISALFRDHGDREDRFNARIKFLVDEWGTEKLRRVLQAEYVDFELPTAGEDLREEYTYNAGKADEAGDYVGVHDQVDGQNFVGLSVLVGRMGADDVIELAELAEAYGSELVGLTQRQNIIVADIADEDLEAFDIGLGGGLGENPQFASWVEMRVAADEVPGYIRNLIEFFADAREDGESFREFIARHETETLTGLVEPEETSYTDPFMHNTKMTWYPYAEADEMDASPAPTNDQGDPLPSDD